MRMGERITIAVASLFFVVLMVAALYWTIKYLFAYAIFMGLLYAVGTGLVALMFLFGTAAGVTMFVVAVMGDK